MDQEIFIERYKTYTEDLYNNQKIAERKLEDSIYRKGKVEIAMKKNIGKLKRIISAIRINETPSKEVYDIIMLLLRILGFSFMNWTDFIVLH